MTRASSKDLTAPLSGSGGGAAESPEEPQLRSDARQSSPPEVGQVASQTGERLQLDPLPHGLRLACAPDAERLFEICTVAFKENGFGGMDERAVRAVIAKGCHGEGVVFGIIDGSARIEAVLGLHPCKMWYGDDNSWYWSELLFYVHPDHRRSLHAHILFRFAQWWERAIKMPVVINVFPTERLQSKERLFSRYATYAGSTWLFGDGEFHRVRRA